MPQDKEYLLKEQTAEAAYQKKLTAGQNIVISPDNVISALGSTAPPTSVTVTPKTLSGENIADMTVNGTTYHLYSSYPRIMTGATTASAGQSGYVPTPYSTDKDYVLYGSGEWKDPHVPVITANPAGSTTTALNKLYLDGTIYGIAGGGGGGGSTVSITPTFADGVKIADYEIDGTSGVLKIPVKELTQTEYDALPSTKLTDNIVYYISGTRVLDPDYTYHTWGENDEIVVRVYHEGESDQSIKWCFRNWNQTSGDMAIPSSLVTYAPTDLSPIYSANYPNGGETQDGWIGFYNNNIRAWIQSTGYTTTGRMYGVVDINGGDHQINPYEDDPYIWISSSINKIIINGTEYGNTGGGGSGAEVIPNPTGVATEGLTKIEIDGTIYSIDGGAPIEEEDVDPNDFINNSESSMNISVDSTTNKLTYQWIGGLQIGTCSVLNYPIDLSIYTGAKVKITTGATAYSTTEFYGINIGVRSGYSTNYIGTSSTGWILQEIFYDLNSTITYAFDFSTLTGTDNYFYICGGGWNFVVDEIVFYKKGESTKVIPNPQEQPTDILESIGIDGTVYELPGADKSIPLFKEGQWLNQDIIEITPYLATIENNKLHCQGLHCGIVVSNIISLSDAVYYSITIKVSSTNGFGFQIGQCVPTTNLDGIIGSGANRITYNNESSFDSGELTITTYNNTNGIFLGGYYQDVNTDYYIEEISLLKITVVKKEYT